MYCTGGTPFSSIPDTVSQLEQLCEIAPKPDNGSLDSGSLPFLMERIIDHDPCSHHLSSVSSLAKCIGIKILLPPEEDHPSNGVTLAIAATNTAQHRASLYLTSEMRSMSHNLILSCITYTVTDRIKASHRLCLRLDSYRARTRRIHHKNKTIA